MSPKETFLSHLTCVLQPVWILSPRFFLRCGPQRVRGLQGGPPAVSDGNPPCSLWGQPAGGHGAGAAGRGRVLGLSWAWATSSCCSRHRRAFLTIDWDVPQRREDSVQYNSRIWWLLAGPRSSQTPKFKAALSQRPLEVPREESVSPNRLSEWDPSPQGVGWAAGPSLSRAGQGMTGGDIACAPHSQADAGR